METRVTLPEAIRNGDEERKNIVAQVYYLHSEIESCSVEGEELVLRFSSHAGDTEGIEERVLALCSELSKSYRKTKFPILDENQGAGTFTENPHPVLEDSRQVIQHMPGVAIYQGEVLSLIRGMDAHFRKYALELGAVEQEYPTTVPLSSLVSNGYVSSFPQHALFVSAAHSDMDSLNRMEGKARSSEGVIDFREELGTADQVLSPTVCYHCFESLRGQMLPESGSLFTALARCHRHEYKTVYGLERLQTFSMREIMSYGGEDFIEANLDAVLEHATRTLRDWGLTFRVIGASDPFFAIEASKKRTYQSLLRLKRELQLYLPYRNEWLAVASFNNHQNTLVKAYAVTGAAGELTSGCVGYGYERLASGIFAQYGVATDQWPGTLRSLL